MAISIIVECDDKNISDTNIKNINFPFEGYITGGYGELYTWILTNLKLINGESICDEYDFVYILNSVEPLIKLRDEIWNDVTDNDDLLKCNLWTFVLEAHNYVKLGGIIYFCFC